MLIFLKSSEFPCKTPAFVREKRNFFHTDPVPSTSLPKNIQTRQVVKFAALKLLVPFFLHYNKTQNCLRLIKHCPAGAKCWLSDTVKKVNVINIYDLICFYICFAISSASEGLPAAKPKQVRQRKKGPAKKEPGLPKNYLMGVFKHFAKTKVSADVYPVLKEM